jgi:hypothetical protein
MEQAILEATMKFLAVPANSSATKAHNRALGSFSAPRTEESMP